MSNSSSTPMVSYDSARDVDDLRGDSFGSLLTGGLFYAATAICLALLSAAFDTTLPFLVKLGDANPFWVPALLLLAAYGARRMGWLSWAQGLYLLGLLAGPTLGIYIHGPNALAYATYIIPGVVANIILSRGKGKITVLSTALMFGTTLLVIPESGLAGVLRTLGLIFPFVLLNLVVMAMLFLNAQMVFTTVQWAIDAQKKDEKRRLLLQRQQDELDHTILQLKSAHSQLELLNTELVRARDDAEQANQLKSQFLANMSHELRTPLNAIMGFADVLDRPRHGQLTDPQRMLRDRIVANGEHLLGLINDILDLAKIESGKMDLFYEEVDLIALCKGVMSTAIGLTKDKGIELELEVPDELPPIWIDNTRVRQVLLNLLSNAAKFTEQGTITLKAQRVDQEFVQLSVQDSGIGIAPEYHALIFEEFRQVDGELTRSYQGTGLGLPICKRLVKMLGGEMWVESEVGSGSTFCFTLPFRKQLDEAPEASPPPELSQSDPLVVVVDDDPNAQELLGHYLGHNGFALYPVLDSREALNVIRQHAPQLVILDIEMPHVNGWEILAQLRADPCTQALPVVLCSVLEEKRFGIALGANGYLVKPVREEEILAAVRRWAKLAGRVLIVDDDPDSRLLVHSILKDTGFEVYAAANGWEGLAMAEQVQPCLLILDLMMPQMDGFEMLQQLRAHPDMSTLPVIIMTAKDLTAEDLHWLQDRSQLCVQKGLVSPEAFLAYVHQLVQTSVAGT